jgi:thioesterase domain-containing protein
VELSIAQMEAAYRHRPGEYRESILVLAAAERMRGSNQDADAIRSDWQRCTRADVEVLITPGNHWTMLQEPQVQSLAEILALKLDQAQTALMPFESTR